MSFPPSLEGAVVTRDFEAWREAHAAWARVWADDQFWERLRSRLRAVAADTTPEEVARVVDEARGELPAQLLEPHVTRVQELRRDQSTRARAHLELIRGAPFAPADIARARGRLALDAGVQIRRLTQQGRLDRALREAQAWIEIDPDNVPLAEQALDVGIEVVETERRRGAVHMFPVSDYISTNIFADSVKVNYLCRL